MPFHFIGIIQIVQRNDENYPWTFLIGFRKIFIGIHTIPISMSHLCKNHPRQ